MKTLLVALAAFAALAVNAAHAGSLAPEPRVIAKFDRDFIERSGAQTLEELLDTGIVRYFLTGGQPLLVLVNGRPYATTSSDLDPLPLSAIERIELLSGDTLGTLDGSAVRGALNVVLRTDLDGVETRMVARVPNRDGGEGRQGSVFWGGAMGDGRMIFGADVLRRQRITAQSREHSRSVWQKDGTFNQAKNVSVGGNTVWVVRRNENSEEDDTTRSVPLGKCDPAKGYTGPLGDPPGPPTSRRQGLRIRLRHHHVEHRHLRATERGPEPGSPARRRGRAPPGGEPHAERFHVPLRAVGRHVSLQAGRGLAAGDQRGSRLGIRSRRQRPVRRGAPLRQPRQPGLADEHRGI